MNDDLIKHTEHGPWLYGLLALAAVLCLVLAPRNELWLAAIAVAILGLSAFCFGRINFVLRRSGLTVSLGPGILSRYVPYSSIATAQCVRLGIYPRLGVIRVRGATCYTVGSRQALQLGLTSGDTLLVAMRACPNLLRELRSKTRIQCSAMHEEPMST